MVGCVTSQFVFVKSWNDKTWSVRGKGPGNRGSVVRTVTAQNGAVHGRLRTFRSLKIFPNFLMYPFDKIL